MSNPVTYCSMRNGSQGFVGFGLAKIVQGGAGNWTRFIAGTLGYMPPGKRPKEPEFGENKDIVYWMHSNIRRSKEKALELVDSTIAKHFKEDAMNVLGIAILCTAKIPACRPSMRMVVQMLEDAEPCTLTNLIVSLSP